MRRRAWAASHLLFAFVGPLVLLVAAGSAMGIVHGLQVGDVGGQVPRVIGAALVQAPAAWTFAAVAMLLFGVLPRAVTAVWAALVLSLLIGQLGPVLQLDQWVLDLSPFTHLPQLPGRRAGVGSAAVADRRRAGSGRARVGRAASTGRRLTPAVGSDSSPSAGRGAPAPITAEQRRQAGVDAVPTGARGSRS